MKPITPTFSDPNVATPAGENTATPAGVALPKIQPSFTELLALGAKEGSQAVARALNIWPEEVERILAQDFVSATPTTSSVIPSEVEESPKIPAWIELIPGIPQKVGRFPLGPTKGSIKAMIASGVLDPNNVFTDEAEWKNAKIDANVPQVFGYTIQDDEELAKVITDPKILEAVREDVEDLGTYLTIYTMNHKARLAYVAHLGGRLPTQEEQKDILDKLPGATVLEKATHAGIPFVGYFGAGNREFGNVGGWTYLVSSSKDGDGDFESLDLGRDKREADEYGTYPKLGYSFLVMFG